jgi:hypothetical protein
VPKYRSAIALTPVWRGDEILIHVHGDIVRVQAPADGIHFAIPDACHFFIASETLWEELDKILEGPKKKKQP